MRDQITDEKYKRYVGGVWTWLPIIAGLTVAIISATVDFSLRAVFLNNLLGPVLGRSVYLLAGLSLIAIGLAHALGFPRDQKRIQTAEAAFSQRMKRHRG